MALAVSSLVLAACGDSSGPDDPGTITSLPRSLTAPEQQTIEASNRFALSLLDALYTAEPDSNLFMSPLSAHMALGMALNGAADSTFEAMRVTLGFDTSDLGEINSAYATLLDLLIGLDPQVQFRIANSVWLRLGFPFMPSFSDTVRAYFDATVATRDFDDPATVDEINNWVDQATNGKIDRMVEAIDPLDIAFLINAIYFKGSWSAQFDPAGTRDEEFHLLDGGSRTVKMMHRGGTYLARFTPEYSAVDLPYGGEAFAMTVIVPAHESILTPAAWDDLLDGFSEVKVHVAMPRLRLEWERELNPALAALGMGIAFFPGLADFSRLSDARDDLYISSVLQKTFVDIDEEGTEAAAATSVKVSATSAPPTIQADRPYLFVIRERLSATILFIGAILDPPSS
jgi:serine protease inhibitor